jgi:hypothetical protein
MKTHPDKVLETLTEKNPARGSSWRSGMKYAGKSTIAQGKVAEKTIARRLLVANAKERQGPSLNTMYLPMAAHFREPLEAWAEWDGMDTKKPTTPVSPRNGVEDLLRQISDPALRSLIGFELARGKQALSELNTLKGQKTLIVNTRPNRKLQRTPKTSKRGQRHAK